MITQAVLILLVILVVANIGIGVFNQFYPPCFDADEYFKGARKLPDGAIAELGSIPSGNDVKYVGVRTVETDDPTVIGLKSWNSIYGESVAKIGMEHPIFEDEEDEYGSTVVREVTKPKQSRQRTQDTIDTLTGNIIPGKMNNVDKDTAYDAISAMYPSNSQLSGNVARKNSDVGGKIVTFEDELEGVKADPRSYTGNKSSNPTIFRNSVERDGYS